MQLGDFCVPKSANDGFMKIWRSFAGARYHVLGNHDMDGGFSREQTAKYYGMPSRFYSFDRRDVHFVVLDGNDRPADHKSGYPRFIADDQIAWLKDDLERTDSPTIVFVHQSIERDGGVQNGAAVRAVLEEANDKAGRRKVVACFSGHHHRDYVRQIANIVSRKSTVRPTTGWLKVSTRSLRRRSQRQASVHQVHRSVPRSALGARHDRRSARIPKNRRATKLVRRPVAMGARPHEGRLGRTDVDGRHCELETPVLIASTAEFSHHATRMSTRTTNRPRRVSRLRHG